MRTEGEFRALLVLLADEEDRVASVAWQTLLNEGQDAVPYLREAAEAAEVRLRGRARLLLEEMRIAELEARWQLYCEQPDDDMELEQGCLLLSYLGGEVDERAISSFLDATAGIVRAHMVNTSSLQALSEVLFDNLGFRGGDFDDPASHYLAKVLERRVGVPISLATVFVLVGQRAGLPVAGVAMPGHYIARVEGPDGPVFVDCFHKGRLYGYDTLRSWLTSRGGSFADEYLAPCSHRFTLFRMLNNLERVYSDAQDDRMAERVRRWRGHLRVQAEA